MKAWLLGGALLASMLAYAGDSKDQWGKDNPYNAKLPEPVSTMAVSISAKSATWDFLGMFVL